MRKSLLAFGSALLLTSTALAREAHIPIDVFRDRVIAKIRATHPEWCFTTTDASGLTYGPSDKACKQGFGSVANIYREYIEQTAQGPEAFVAKFIAVVIDTPKELTDPDKLRTNLVVVLRPKFYEAGVPDGIAKEPWSDILTRRAFFGDLDAVLMRDSPTALLTVSREQLAKAEISEEEAFKLAAENLRRLIGPLVGEVVDNEPPVTVVAAESALATGYLWLPESCPADDPGRAVLVVEREKYYRIDDPSVRARSWFAGFAAHLAGIEESLSATILVCERGAWRVWDPTPPGP